MKKAKQISTIAMSGILAAAMIAPCMQATTSPVSAKSKYEKTYTVRNGRTA